MGTLPRLLKQLYVWYLRYLKRDEIYAGLVEGWHEKTMTEYWPLLAQREDYRRRWFEAWQEAELDYLLTVPNSLPAYPHLGMKDGFKSLGYTFLFNIVSHYLFLIKGNHFVEPFPQLDVTAGVMPITKVDATLDQVPSGFKPRNSIEKSTYKMYDSTAMHGLPVGVQIVGKRLEEEKVLEGMELIEEALHKVDRRYRLLNE
jgi:hypothetical protein